MSAKPNYLSIGIFVLVGVAILVAGLIVFGAGTLFRKKIHVETYIKGSVQGLDIGSPLKFRGVTIGQVTAIGFTFNDYEIAKKNNQRNYVIVRMVIDREIFPGMFTDDLTPILAQNVESGLRARIEPQGVTGVNFINMDYLKDADRFPPLPFDWKPYTYYIPSAPAEIASFLDSINDILRSVEELNLKGIGQNASALLENLNIAVTEANIGKLSSDLQNLVNNLDQAMDDLNPEQLSADAQALLAGVKASNDELRVIFKNIQPASELNADDISEIILNFRVVSENLRQLSENTQRYPSRTLFGPAPAKPGVFDKKRP